VGLLDFRLGIPDKATLKARLMARIRPQGTQWTITTQFVRYRERRAYCAVVEALEDLVYERQLERSSAVAQGWDLNPTYAGLSVWRLPIRR
jgi:hypothetical protein